MEIADGSTWTLTGDSYITSLTCGADAIDLNGHTLYVNGKAYEAGSTSTGDAIEVTVSEAAQGGQGGTPPEGAPDGQGGTPPEKPDGTPGGQGGTPPEKPAN